MLSQLEIPRPADIGRLLRGEKEILSAWSQRWVPGRFAWQVAVIILGAGLYGAAMGWWRAPQEALYVAIKFPLIILLVTVGNALLNAILAPLLGLNIGLGQSFSAMLMSFTVASAILGAFSPVVAFLTWNAPSLSSNVATASTHNVILLTHVLVIALAGTTGNVRLLQLLEHLSPTRIVARRVLAAWLAGNLFLGTQLTWIFRPLIGSPDLPVQFLRANALHGNFYETVFHSLGQIITH